MLGKMAPAPSRQRSAISALGLVRWALTLLVSTWSLLGSRQAWIRNPGSTMGQIGRFLLNMRLTTWRWGRVVPAHNVNAAFPERNGTKTVTSTKNALFPKEKLAMRRGMPHIPLISDAAVSQEIQVSVC